jgi:hypothetical protein
VVCEARRKSGEPAGQRSRVSKLAHNGGESGKGALVAQNKLVQLVLLENEAFHHGLRALALAVCLERQMVR